MLLGQVPVQISSRQAAAGQVAVREQEVCDGAGPLRAMGHMESQALRGCTPSLHAAEGAIKAGAPHLRCPVRPSAMSMPACV